ncbi:hypothetical protein [Cellulosimicrobium aquatile]|uniref:hypothetical protein n=1 Tax=Cellulosimicrobium aquatile TaxID=1612203 RepID=UPI001459D345|nr:hypothetical protein [Cellulosimicrobium aquatile]NMF29608.1 hypothetical protein [Cellulosimicrobium aquatile]
MQIDWTAVGGIATAATAVVAIWAIAAAKNDSRDRSRPVMVAEYRTFPFAYQALEFVIRNAGASVARDVAVTFDPPLEPGGYFARSYMIRRYAEQIAVVAPGQELVNAVRVVEQPGKPMDLPEDLTVTIRYRRSRWRRYEDVYRLRMSVMGEDSRQKSSETAEGRLQQIRESLDRIAVQVERLGEAGSRAG